MAKKGWEKGTEWGKSAGKWSLTKSWQQLKKRPWTFGKAAVGTYAFATGYFPAAITAYAFWKLGKWSYRWGRKKLTGQEVPAPQKNQVDTKKAA